MRLARTIRFVAFPVALLVSAGCGLDAVGLSASDDTGHPGSDGRDGEVRVDADGDVRDVRDADVRVDADGGPVCGDGVTEAGEQCDDGLDNSDTLPDACRTDCRTAHCGDGVVDTGELCDDGNTIPGDACTNECTTVGCGDGVVAGVEECDDGDDDDTDDCLHTCRLAACGDGFIWAGHEDCDGDAPRGCSTSCGSTGFQSCVDCAWTADCAPPFEACNGEDDDCDTVADNGFGCAAGAAASCTTRCGTTGSGTCAADCTPAASAACTPPAETCNGEDDDCDGSTDNGLECVPGARSTCGPCDAGQRTCTATCTWPDCTVPDDVCSAGTTEPCVPATCASGHRTCETGCWWGDCVPDHSDCTPSATRSCTVASCGTGSQTCGTDCAWGACGVPPCSHSWETCCPGVGCVNLDGDARHCGSCDHECGTMSPCTGGSCWW
jgi:cysteine-rich repeat protein